VPPCPPMMNSSVTLFASFCWSRSLELLRRPGFIRSAQNLYSTTFARPPGIRSAKSREPSAHIDLQFCGAYLVPARTAVGERQSLGARSSSHWHHAVRSLQIAIAAPHHRKRGYRSISLPSTRSRKRSAAKGQKNAFTHNVETIIQIVDCTLERKRLRLTR
jgi:hypothetical protein